MATKISHQIYKYRPPPPYLGNIPKKKTSFTASLIKVMFSAFKIAHQIHFLCCPKAENFLLLTHQIVLRSRAAQVVPAWQPGCEKMMKE